MDFLRYLPTYLPDLSEDLARSRKVFLIRLEQELADLEGPPQAVLTKEQNKSLEK